MNLKIALFYDGIIFMFIGSWLKSPELAFVGVGLVMAWLVLFLAIEHDDGPLCFAEHERGFFGFRKRGTHSSD